jgi:hypothetical protein
MFGLCSFSSAFSVTGEGFFCASYFIVFCGWIGHIGVSFLDSCLVFVDRIILKGAKYFQKGMYAFFCNSRAYI